MTPENIAEHNTILRGRIGSEALGLSVPGISDRDEMGVFVEPQWNVLGLEPLDHCVIRSQPQGVRSQPGDLDLTLYSLRKFCRLLVGGNPSVIMLLWLPEYTVTTEVGKQLLNIRSAFFSAKSGRHFLGYMQNEKKKLTGERAKNVNRPELVEKHGYDTKLAMHILRLGYQGIEYMETRRLTLPMPDAQRDVLRSIRGGEYNLSDAIAIINKVDEELKYLVNECDAEVNLARINHFMTHAHLRHWDVEYVPW